MTLKVFPFGTSKFWIEVRRSCLIRKAHQRMLFPAMSEHSGQLAQSALRQVAELENVIAAEPILARETNRVRRG
jgi:hypothetical protein